MTKNETEANTKSQKILWIVQIGPLARLVAPTGKNTHGDILEKMHLFGCIWRREQ